MDRSDMHSYAEQYACDIEANGHARVALNHRGELAATRAAFAQLAEVTMVEPMPKWRTRITVDTGRTFTLPDRRWVLCEYSGWREHRGQ